MNRAGALARFTSWLCRRERYGPPLRLRRGGCGLERRFGIVFLWKPEATFRDDAVEQRALWAGLDGLPCPFSPAPGQTPIILLIRREARGASAHHSGPRADVGKLASGLSRGAREICAGPRVWATHRRRFPCNGCCIRGSGPDRVACCKRRATAVRRMWTSRCGAGATLRNAPQCGEHVVIGHSQPPMWCGVAHLGTRP